MVDEKIREKKMTLIRSLSYIATAGGAGGSLHYAVQYGDWKVFAVGVMWALGGFFMGAVD